MVDSISNAATDVNPDFKAVALILLGLVFLLREIRTFMGQSTVRQFERLLQKLDQIVETIHQHDDRHRDTNQIVKRIEAMIHTNNERRRR